MPKHAVFIHKFGGSSLADPAAFFRVAKLVLAQSDGSTESKTFVIVSARYGLTNTLHRLVEGAMQGKIPSSEIKRLHHAQRMFVCALYAFGGMSMTGDLEPELNLLDSDMRCIEENLNELSESGFVEASYNMVIGFGEIWSARLLGAVLVGLVEPGISNPVQVEWINARKFLFARKQGSSIEIDMPRSKGLLENEIQSNRARFWVVTGYISSFYDGGPANLGRNGSDYTAALITVLLDAKSMTIWSDVNGILNIDPDLKEDAEVLTRVSYREACELAELGSGVLHPNTLTPLRHKSAALSLKNSLNLEQKGTVIEHVVPRSMGIATGLSDVSILCFSPSGHFDFNNLLEKASMPVLAVSQNNDRVCIACRLSDLPQVLHFVKNPVHGWIPGSIEVTQGSLLGWVSHDIISCIEKRGIWDRVMGQIGRELVFQATRQDVLLAFIRRRDSSSDTRLLHSEMGRENEMRFEETG